MCACVCVYNTMEPVYYGHFGISRKCPDYQVWYPDFPGLSFGIKAGCVDYAGLYILQVS